MSKKLTTLIAPVIFSPTYIKRIRGFFGTSLAAYWPKSEASGSVAYDQSGNGRNGAYTGVDLANIMGPAKTKTRAPYFDGANDVCNVYSASLVTGFPYHAGSFFIWLKVLNVGVWTDALFRRGIYFAQHTTNNYVSLHKTSTNNQFIIQRSANAISDYVTIAGLTTVDWFLVGITFSEAADQLIAYLNGAQTGATQTGLGVWSVENLNSTACCIGSESTAHLQTWNGWAAHSFILNRVATPAEVATVYNWGA